MNKQRYADLSNVLADPSGRNFIRQLLSDCGIILGDGISFRHSKTAHELGLDLINEIMYNHIDGLKKLISEQKTLKEVENDRGSEADD